MNYLALKQLIIDTSESTEASFVAHIPDFVQAAEYKCYNAVPVLATRKNATGACTAGLPYLAVPTDWLASYSLAYIDGTGQSHYLLNKEPDFMREAFPTASTVGPPTHYGIYDFQTLILGPTPDSNYTMEFNYFGYPTSIVTAGNTWLGDNFYTPLFYAAMGFAYVYQKGEADVLQQYDKLFTESITELKIMVQGKNTRDRFRNAQTRVQVP